jgi:hypothetical protein
MFCGAPMKGSYRVQKHGYGNDYAATACYSFCYMPPRPRQTNQPWTDE